MANSTLTFYLTELVPEKNALVENFDDYLNSCFKISLPDVQYFKNELETQIKLNSADIPFVGGQKAVDNFELFNYVKVQNSDNDYRVFYYFITDTKWISEKTIQIKLYMDTINTFQNKIIGHFTDKTQIHRQHKDRFHKRASAMPATGLVKLMRAVDETPEGLPNIPLIRTITGAAIENNTPWTLMYITDGKSSASTLSNVTKIYAASANVSQVVEGTSLTTILGPDAFDTTDEGIIRIMTFPYSPFGVISSSGVLPSVPAHWNIVSVTENISGGGGNGTAGFKSSGKVLCMDISYGNNLNDIWETFLGASPLPYVNQSVDAANIQNYPKNALWESKLYHSDFFNLKFLYDNYSKDIRYEHVSHTSASPTDTAVDKAVNIYFYPSTGVSSKCMFKFVPKNYYYKNIADYEEYLVSERNLEPTRLNNNFVNYIRNGYNYDKKAHDIQTTSGLINYGVDQTKNAINMITSGGAGNYGSMAGSFGSMITSTTNMITKELLYENSLQQKLAGLAAQASTVSGCDDLSLLRTYNGNRLNEHIYKPTDRMQEVLLDRFYYTGYADERQAIPNLNSRRMFNFIQCDPVFDDENEVGFYKYLKEIKERFSLGVTVYHKFTFNNAAKWDLDNSNLENWETWICPR